MSSIEIEEAKKNFQKGLYTGITELILLGVVGQAEKPIYGYQIAKIIENENSEIPVIKLGTLYPVLRSLEKNGFLESRIDPSITGPPRRYYRITQSGKDALEQLTHAWENTKLFVKKILEGIDYDKKH
jgi:PadR family transcriptional regulator, regulatory protein PadR